MKSDFERYRDFIINHTLPQAKQSKDDNGYERVCDIVDHYLDLLFSSNTNAAIADFKASLECPEEHLANIMGLPPFDEWVSSWEAELQETYHGYQDDLDGRLERGEVG